MKPISPLAVKLCVTCKHCRFSPMEPDLSEITLGSDLKMYCDLPLTKRDNAGRVRVQKDARWDIDDAVSLADVREMLLMAETCPDYALYVEEGRADG